MFVQLLEEISRAAKMDFNIAADVLIRYIDTAENFLDILTQIGTIPETIGLDSTEEKLFAKTSDAVLSRAFCEIGLKSTSLKERANSGDVQAESQYYGYTLVADAKAFRMSRTAKNQKDFKVAALSGWKKDADYAVLCAPLFHYPKIKSQIYAQAIEYNVCLLCWEDLIFMVSEGVKESPSINLAYLWNYNKILAQSVSVADSQKCFLGLYRSNLLSTLGYRKNDYADMLKKHVLAIQKRGATEKLYWKHEKEVILGYSKQKAIEELIKTKKIDEKVQQIDLFIKGAGFDD